jgi:AraC-like DNA-binding protein
MLARLQVAPDVGPAVAATGYSHRRVVALFREAVGLGPKLFCRVRRFQRVLEALRTHPATGWAELALAAGYSDQAHLVREFRAFSGLTPGAHRRLAPANANHVPIPAGVNSVQDTSAATGQNRRIPDPAEGDPA